MFHGTIQKVTSFYDLKRCRMKHFWRK